MGVIVTKNYVCDYCNQPIDDAGAIVGKLSLRKQGTRGLGREVGLILHPVCSDRLTAHASGVVRTRRPRASLDVTPEPEPVAETEPAALAPKKPARRRSKGSASEG